MSSDFYLPILVDEDVLWADVANFLAVPMELVACRDQSVDQVPELRLFEILLFELRPVANFVGEHVGEVIENDLLNKPLEPQKPSFQNWYFSGSRSQSESAGASLRANTHWLYSLSLATGNFTSILSSSSLLVISLMLWKRGWLIFSSSCCSPLGLGCCDSPAPICVVPYIKLSNIQRIFTASGHRTPYNIFVMNPYKVLQLPEDASYEQIKERYRHLSKMIHPDKHPIENYQLAQAKFKELDDAYKAIASDLRRYIYKHYGVQGIQILDNNSYRFQDFEKADLDDPTVLNKLNKLLTYCLYEQYAAMESDKNSLESRSIVVMFKPLNKVSQLPYLQQTQFGFETSLPDFAGLSNSINITHSSSDLGSNSKSKVLYGVTSSRRITETLMLNINTHISENKFDVQAGVAQNVGNNLIVHFSPVNMSNGRLGGVQLGADFSRNNYYISGVTDFNSFNVLFGSSPNNKAEAKVLKFSFDEDGVGVSPIFQKNLTDNLRIFIHIQLKADSSNKNFAGAVQYGYKLKLLQQLKLQLTSNIASAHTYFQIALVSPKFKATIPIFSRADLLRFEAFKLAAFVGVYLSYELYNYYMRRNSRARKRLEFQNYNRMSVENNAVGKANSDYAHVAADSREAEAKYNGLVIALAYIGSDTSIKRARRLIKKHIDLKQRYEHVDVLLRRVETFRGQIKTNEHSHREEMHELTDLMQAKVKGSQLFTYNIQELGVNPCMDEKQPYSTLILYFLKNKAVLLTQPGNKEIKLGNMHKHYEKPFYLQVFHYFRNMLIN